MKVFEVIDQSEWENSVFKIGQKMSDEARQRHWTERDRKMRAIRHEDNILANRYVDLEQKYPNEIKSRGVPDDNDHESEYMEVPTAVEEDPKAWTTIESPGRWTYDDMRENDAYPDPHEEYYVLKASPRHQIVVNILNRHLQLVRLRHKMYAWPPVVRE